MTTFAVQYLGTRPKEATPAAVRARLREAFERLPISMVLLDWDLPPALEEAVAIETQAHHAKLYRWQTWLTGDHHTDLPEEWAVVGLNNKPVSGYANEADFTFVCPNHSGVEDFLSERMEDIAARGLFQGVFLDRIRFPSPAADPSTHLGCFCRHCRRLAADRGLDLEAARLAIEELFKSKEGIASLCRSLLDTPKGNRTRIARKKRIFADKAFENIRRPHSENDPTGLRPPPQIAQSTGDLGRTKAGMDRCKIGQRTGDLGRERDIVERVLDFREESVTRVAGAAFRQAKSLNLEVGLDCFSPALTRMVGQDLNSLCKLSDWVKIMTYPRVFGPAGISFELLDLLDWLTGKGLKENEAIRLLEEASGLHLPPARADLRQNGLGSESIAQEIERGRTDGGMDLLAGIALVEVKGVHESTSEQIQADLTAAKDSDGLVLSWDLWAIPLNTVDMIRRIWEIQ